MPLCRKICVVRLFIIAATTLTCMGLEPAEAANRFYNPALGKEILAKRQWRKLSALRLAISVPRRGLDTNLFNTRADVVDDDETNVSGDPNDRLRTANYPLYALRRMSVPYLRSNALRPMTVAAMLQQIHENSFVVKGILPRGNSKEISYDYVIVGSGPHAQKAIDRILSDHFEKAYARQDYDAEPPSILVVEKGGDIGATFAKNRTIKANSPSRAQPVGENQFADALRYGNRNPLPGAIQPADISREPFPMLGDLADLTLAHHFMSGVDTVMYGQVTKIAPSREGDGVEVVRIRDSSKKSSYAVAVSGSDYCVNALKGVIIATGIGAVRIPQGLDKESRQLLLDEIYAYGIFPDDTKVITAEQFSQRLQREGRARYLVGKGKTDLPIAIIGGGNTSYTSLEQLFQYHMSDADPAVQQEGRRRDIIVFSGQSAAPDCAQVRATIPARYASSILRVLFPGVGRDNRKKPLPQDSVRTQVSRFAGDSGSVTKIKKINNNKFEITTPTGKYVVGDIILATGYDTLPAVDVGSGDFQFITDRQNDKRRVGQRAYNENGGARRILRVGTAVGEDLVTDEETDNPENKVSLFKTLPKTDEAVAGLLEENEATFLDQKLSQTSLGQNARAYLEQQKQNVSDPNSRPMVLRRKGPRDRSVIRIDQYYNPLKLPTLAVDNNHEEARYETVFGPLFKRVRFNTYDDTADNDTRTFRFVIDNTGTVTADDDLIPDQIVTQINADPVACAMLYPFLRDSMRPRSISYNKIIIEGSYDDNGNVILDRSFKVSLKR